jgi:hypothetical protein
MRNVRHLLIFATALLPLPSQPTTFLHCHHDGDGCGVALGNCYTYRVCANAGIWVCSEASYMTWFALLLLLLLQQ